MILAGDIGGTKTHLAIFNDGEKLKWTKHEKFPSRNYASLLEIINIFLVDQPAIKKACFGIAGPVRNNRSKLSNLPWVIDGSEIASKLHIKQAHLINDLEANAFGLQVLEKSELLNLNEGTEQVGNAALISAGTGLGEAGLFWDGKKHQPFACEGGHCSFAPRDELEMELLRYLKQKWEHVSFERVLSGMGLCNLYQFLIDNRLEEEQKSVKMAMLEGDPAKVITDNALKGESKACVRALEWFVSIYGSEAGNLALKMLSLGGMYVGGGIAPKILSVIKKGGFMKAFKGKGRFEELLSSIPVNVVLNENTALLGAARYAQERG